MRSYGIGDTDGHLNKEDGGRLFKDGDCNKVGWYILPVKVEGVIKFSAFYQTTGNFATTKVNSEPSIP